MRITIFGSGYVGLVTGACLADVGNDVLLIDVDADKVASLTRGEVPIYEPGLADMIVHNQRGNRIRFSTDAASGVQHAELQMIAVGTPSDAEGRADLRHVRSVAETIANHMQDRKIIITKSTVPVGTGDMVSSLVSDVLQARGVALEYEVVSNPEFLKEGAAIADFRKPDRIIVGTSSARALRQLQALYAPFNRNHDRILSMDIRSAELTKYAANAMLATKISFMNEMANLAEYLGADIERVRLGIGSDPRIGYHFIYAGCGYGGSCFPKDLSALYQAGQSVGYHTEVVAAVESVNRQQKQRLFDKIRAFFGADLQGKVIALWGLAFKPNTDDMREAPSRYLMEALWAAGARVRVFDPVAMAETKRIYGEREDLSFAIGPYDALEGADALAVLTEWSVFQSPDLTRVRALLRQPVVFDGRNIYSPEWVAEEGLQYFGIGRGVASPDRVQRSLQ